MKSAFLVFVSVLTLSSTAFSSEQTLSLPSGLKERHVAACPEFGTEDGRWFQRSVSVLPQSEHSKQINTLYVLGCEVYAYNSLERAYIVSEDGTITDVWVTEIDHEGKLTATKDLMGAGYDEETQHLYTFVKGRGIGDCGAASSYHYSAEDQKFFLREARIKNQCDGDFESDWPVVYSH